MILFELMRVGFSGFGILVVFWADAGFPEFRFIWWFRFLVCCLRFGFSRFECFMDLGILGGFAFAIVKGRVWVEWWFGEISFSRGDFGLCGFDNCFCFFLVGFGLVFCLGWWVGYLLTWCWVGILVFGVL